MLIRKATLEDSKWIADYLLLAMEDIIYKLIGAKDPVQAKAFMFHFVQTENNQFSYQNCWVGEVGQKVVAAVNVYDGARLEALRKPVIEYLNAHFGVTRIPEDETEAGEYYIDTIGVNPDEQGKGIGSSMLQFLIEHYVQKQGIALGLLVDEENPGAKKLYVKLGFKSIGKKVLLGKKMEHLQMGR